MARMIERLENKGCTEELVINSHAAPVKIIFPHTRIISHADGSHIVWII